MLFETPKMLFINSQNVIHKTPKMLFINSQNVIHKICKCPLLALKSPHIKSY